MLTYEVSGEVKFARDCDCELCPGHNHYVDVRFDIEHDPEGDLAQMLPGLSVLEFEGDVIDELVWARKPKGADVDTWTWVGEPRLQLISEEMRMRRAGAPMLPGL